MVFDNVIRELIHCKDLPRATVDVRAKGLLTFLYKNNFQTITISLLAGTPTKAGVSIIWIDRGGKKGGEWEGCQPSKGWQPW
ncbi:MAG: hypothetical protein ABIP35_13140 [Ginsengibacter sp.]